MESRPARRRRLPRYRRSSLATESVRRPRSDGSVLLQDNGTDYTSSPLMHRAFLVGASFLFEVRSRMIAAVQLTLELD
jgi:hypothetical protein